MAVDTYPDLFWAYTAVWVVITLYIAWLGARLVRLERSRGDRRQAPGTKRGEL